MTNRPINDHTALPALTDLWTLADCDPDALARVSLTGRDPAVPSVFKVGTAAAASIAAAALAATEIWRLRTGRAQTVAVDMRAAAAEFASERFMRRDNAPPPPLWDAIAGLYQTGDAHWIRLHTNFPHHRQRALELLNCAAERSAVQSAVSRYQGEALEAALVERGACAALVRSCEGWREHPQGRAVAALPVLEIVRIGAAEPRNPGTAPRPLAGIRVLDCTRVVAGPVGGRCLAGHGAEVMRIGAPHLPSIEPLVMDTGRGKLSAWLDLGDNSDRQRLWQLVRASDIFMQAYRPGALARHGFSPRAMAQARPGIIYVSLCAYSHVGPWCMRRGYDSLVQCSAGIAHEGGVAAGTTGPKHLPCQALDHATGVLAAFGAMVALHRRMRQGGSWLVRVSLAQTARWLDGLGRVAGAHAPDLAWADIQNLICREDTPFGQLAYVAPAARLSATPLHWTRPPVPLGTHAPVWP